MIKEKSLKKILLNNFLIIAIVPFVIALSAGAIYMSSFMSQELQTNQEAFLNLLNYESSRILSEPEVLLNEVDTYYHNHIIDLEHITEYMDTVIKVNPLFESLQIIDAEGKIIRATTDEYELVGFDMSYRGFYISRGDYETFYWSQVFISPETSKPTISVVKKGIGPYFLMVNYSLGELQEIIKAIDSKHIDEFTIVDHNGQYIAHSDYDYVAQRRYDQNFSAYKFNESYILEYNRQAFYVRVTEMADRDMSIMIKTDYYRYFNNVIKILLVGLIGMVMVSLVIVYMSNRQSKRILKPIDYLVEEVGKITNGQYGEDVRLDAYQELNLLTRYFNTMSQTLKENFDYLSDSRMELESLNQDLMIQNDEIANSEIEMATILGNLYSGIMLLSPKLDILRMNQSVYRLLQIDTSKVSHHVNAIEFFADTKDICRKHSIDMVLFSKKKLTTLVEVDNTLIEQTIIPLTNKKTDITGIIVTFNDITEQRKLESQLNQSMKMEAIGRLSGGIAHDFNNILQIIIGYGELIDLQLQNIEGTQNVQRQMRLLTEAGKKAEKLIKKLMLFSKMHTSTPSKVDANRIVKEIQSLLSGIIGDDILLVTELESDLKYIFADQTQVEQTIMNLCVNAKDAMEGGGMILIKTYNEIKYYKSYVCIEVKDNGVGIPKHIQDKIFDPFFTTKDIGKGTGLGLSTVLGIVEKNHGFVELDSEEGKGSTFRLFFPAAMNDEVPVAENEMKLEEATFSHYTILMAEDDPGVREIARNILEASGATVIEASDGEEAIKKFHEFKESIDLLLFDVLMPVVNGLEAYEAIKSIIPTIKVIFTTGYSNELLNTEYNLHVGGKIIQKPYKKHTLLTAVYEVIKSMNSEE